MDYLSGSIYSRGGFVDGYICVEDGVIVDICDGLCPERPLHHGIIVPMMVNAHTHAADGGVAVRSGMSIESLVAPPNGLKHRYLRDTPGDILEGSMAEYRRSSESNGIANFIDFREDGAEGCRLLRKAAPDSIVLGRPVSVEYDETEIDSILDIADVIGISSISDMDHGYIESVADRVRERKKIFSVHASERIREDMDFILSLDPAFVVHMVEATNEDLLKCAEAEVPVVVCPRSNAFFGKVAPIREMIRCGVDISLGTDNAMLCSPDMRAEAGEFFRILEAQKGDPGYTWKAMIDNGRRLIYNLDKSELKKGNRAELAILPCPGDHSLKGMLSSTDKIVTYR